MCGAPCQLPAWVGVEVRLVKLNDIALYGTLSESYSVTCHMGSGSVLPASRHK